jgi:hypothetical protein
MVNRYPESERECKLQNILDAQNVFLQAKATGHYRPHKLPRITSKCIVGRDNRPLVVAATRPAVAERARKSMFDSMRVILKDNHTVSYLTNRM